MIEPLYWSKAKEYLCKKDKKLSKIISSHDGHLSTKKNPFYSLCKSIVGQQISVQSADSVWKKLVKRCNRISPRNINRLGKQDLLDCGLSRQKSEYIKLL
ncbi:MAG: DNA-3-methyladenine glycosylase 2 family protein, partial [Candidatus Dadabacteria bacterium]